MTKDELFLVRAIKPTDAPLEMLSLLAYECHRNYTAWKQGKSKSDRKDLLAAIHTAEHACFLLGISSHYTSQVRAGKISGLRNRAKLSGGSYENDYDFSHAD